MMEQKIKIVTFDLDGTLVDAYRAVSQSLNYALTMFQYPPIDDETIRRSVGWGDRHLMARFVKEDHVDRVLSVYRQHHKQALKAGTKFLPGAKELLLKLKHQGYILTVASNRPTRFTQIILKHLNIASVFNYVLCADKVKNPKPAGDLLLETLKKFSLHCDQMIYVADMTIDVETGQAAGVKTIIVTSGSSTKQEIERLKPFRVIDHLSSVEDILEELKCYA